MSKISTVYAALVSEIGTLFPTKTRLHNPYQVEENPELSRKNAWGLRVGSGDREVSEFCSLTIGRNFTVVLVREFVSLAKHPDGFDAVTVALLEDQQSLAQLLHSPDELSQGELIDRIDVAPLSEITESVSGEKKELRAEINFTIYISEGV